jgi:hypothetical protein
MQPPVVLGEVMHGANGVSAIARIQMPHFSSSAAGVGLALSKGMPHALLEARRVFRVLWPLSVITLGVLLMLYLE